MSVSPAHANPATSTLPGAIVAPSVGRVISDLTTSPVNGAMSLASTAAPGATRFVGYRYAVTTQKLSDSRSATRRFVSHFTEYAPSQPGTMARNGDPWSR